MATKDMANPAAALSGLPLLLRVDEAAALARVTRRTIARWIEDGLVPSSKPVRGGGSSPRLIPRDAFLRFLGVEAA